jgi:hypothetical protein
MRRAAGLVLAALAIVAGALPAGAAADDRPVESVTVYLESAKHPLHHVLTLRVWPLEGMATVVTYPDVAETENGRGVIYAVAFPPHPFDGSLEITLPGLGEFVGTVAPKEPGNCRGGAQLTHFDGRIEFHGAGGYGTWRGTRAPATVTRSCTKPAEKRASTKDLAAIVSELGPRLPGPSLVRFEAFSRDRSLAFAMFGDRQHGASFVGVDREWLPGEVAVERWASRQRLSFAGTVTMGPGGRHPARIAFRPPRPFFGVGHYDRHSHRLTGSLGAEFLGLRARLTSRPLIAVLEDEEVGVE